MCNCKLEEEEELPNDRLMFEQQRNRNNNLHQMKHNQCQTQFQEKKRTNLEQTCHFVDRKRCFCSRMMLLITILVTISPLVVESVKDTTNTTMTVQQERRQRHSSSYFVEPETDNIHRIAVGRPVKFTCVVNDIGDLKIHWFHKDKRMLLAIGNSTVAWRDRLHVSSQSNSVFSLVIDPVQLEDKGHFSCNLNTQPVQSQVHVLDVVQSPQIRENDTTIKIEPVKEFDSVILKCVADGIPKPLIKWRRESQSHLMPPLEDDEELEQSNEVNGEESSITLPNSQKMAEQTQQASDVVLSSSNFQTTPRSQESVDLSVVSSSTLSSGNPAILTLDMPKAGKASTLGRSGEKLGAELNVNLPSSWSSSASLETSDSNANIAADRTARTESVSQARSIGEKHREQATDATLNNITKKRTSATGSLSNGGGGGSEMGRHRNQHQYRKSGYSRQAAHHATTSKATSSAQSSLTSPSTPLRATIIFVLMATTLLWFL